MKALSWGILVAAALALAACGTRTESSVTPTAGATPMVAGMKPVAKDPKTVVVTENDITNRPYVALGDISVTVKKWTIFDADPTREKVADALREKAAEMGADAVVLARYGTVGIGLMRNRQIRPDGRSAGRISNAIWLWRNIARRAL